MLMSQIGVGVVVMDARRAPRKTIQANDPLAQLYFISRRAILPWTVFSMPKDGSDIHRFPTVQVVKTKKCVNIRAILRRTGKIQT